LIGFDQPGELCPSHVACRVHLADLEPNSVEGEIGRKGEGFEDGVALDEGAEPSGAAAQGGRLDTQLLGDFPVRGGFGALPP
jgi:hypothetical protein